MSTHHPGAMSPAALPITKKVEPKPGEILQSAPAPPLALTLLFSRDEPWRVGEVLFPGAPAGARTILGRGAVMNDPTVLHLWRQRPSENLDTGPLGANAAEFSRAAARVTLEGADAVRMEALGDHRIEVGDSTATSCRVAEGDTVALQARCDGGIWITSALFRVVRRPRHLDLDVRSELIPDFGRSDAGGMVGESLATWRLRAEISAAARLGKHVLVVGESRSGKELVAGALHRLTEYHARPILSVNAGNIPPGAAETSLFGCLEGFAASCKVDGLCSEADGRLFHLDEVGKFGDTLLQRLLRTMETGSYSVVGSTRELKSRFMLVATTSRSEELLPGDFVNRCRVIRVAPLRDRSEDSPLLMYHALRELARGGKTGHTPEALDAHCGPLFTAELVKRVVTSDLPRNYKDVESTVEDAALLERELPLGKRLGPAPPVPPDPLQALWDWLGPPEAERVQLLERHGWHPSAAAADPSADRGRVTFYMLRAKVGRWGLDQRSDPVEAAALLSGASAADLRAGTAGAGPRRLLRSLRALVASNGVAP